MTAATKEAPKIKTNKAFDPAQQAETVRDSATLRDEFDMAMITSQPWEIVTESDRVVYYPGGNVNGDTFLAAIVSQVREPGLLSLHVFHPGKPNCDVRGMAYHPDSKALRDNPKLAAKYGVWDTPDNHRRRQWEKKEAKRADARHAAEDRKKREAALKEQNLAIESRVLELRTKNMNHQEIADALGDGFTAERVATVLRRAVARTGA